MIKDKTYIHIRINKELYEKLKTKTKKQPSPDVNPANRSPSGIAIFSTIGLTAGIILGKAIFKLSDKPKFKEALKLRIIKSPS